MDDVTVVNTDQAEAWNGDEGAHWTANAERYDTLISAFNEHLFAAAAIAETAAVLDVGCGCGQTTRLAAAAASRGRAVGVDLSAPMLAYGRDAARAAGLDNVSFEQGDAQVADLGSEAFDVAISRFGIMFFADPVAAFANVRRAVRPGGRLTALCWRDMAENAWLMVPAGAALEFVPFPDLGGPDEPGPFSLADPARVDAVLTAAGYGDIAVTPVDAPMTLGRDAVDATGFLAGTGVARALLDDIDEATKARALDAVTDALRPYESPAGVVLGGAAWVVTASR